MGAINNILGMPPGLNKNDKSKQTGEIGNNSSKKGKTRKTEGSVVSGFDKAVISNEAQKLLTQKKEAAQHTQKVQDAQTISKAEIESIKEKIASDYYFEPEVIDKVVDKLIALPNFSKAM